MLGLILPLGAAILQVIREIHVSRRSEIVAGDEARRQRPQALVGDI
jgi:hypothetical protein